MTIPVETHGGDVQRVAREYGIIASELLDFSANINPRGLPPGAAKRLAHESSDSALLMQYPDPEAHELRQTLSKRLDVPIDAIVIGAGAGALIAAGVRALRPRSCLVPVPAFCEYERACTASGCAVHPFKLDARTDFALDFGALSRRMDRAGHDFLIVNNPHNPSGAVADRGAMLQLLDAARAAGAGVLIDEAFIETAVAVERPCVIAVRSLTKFYGCPALRVGYAVASPETAKRVAAQLPAWPVTTLALNAMVEALEDAAYARATLEENERERVGFSSALGELGLYVFPSAANFLLLRLPEDCCSSAQLRERLILDHCILVRNCDSFDDLEMGRFIRVAVRSEGDNNRLVEAISKILRG